MKRLVVIMITLSLVLTSVPAFAAKGSRGASQQAYEHASDKAVFHRVSDWFATVGKSPEEKEKIIAERDAERAVKRAEKEAAKLEKQAKKETKKAGKETKRTKRNLLGN
ncbi:MAG: hypothetical protein HQ572_02610 [Candidatus Omnitrophica bacterium]|nr:hypothetical protein [Candidatus Omnitrophota bacterium]